MSRLFRTFTLYVSAIRPRMAILCLLFLSTLLCAFDTPEVICIMIGEPQGRTYFGNRFCCVGDVNGDGFDDLLASHDQYQPNPLHSNTNQVKLFYGGEDMDDEADVIFGIEGENMGIGDGINYLGNLLPNQSPFVAFNNFMDLPGGGIEESYLSLYRLGQDPDDDPEFVFHRVYSTSHLGIGRQGHRTRPTDFNGDDFDDLITTRVGGIDVFYGGQEFDTIPNWTTNLPMYSSPAGGGGGLELPVFQVASTLTLTVMTTCC